MDWKIFTSTFFAILIAELGDKTQFAAMAASASSKSTWSVMLAVVLALSVAGAIGVIAGRALGEYLSPKLLQYISGSLFLAMGVWILFRNNS